MADKPRRRNSKADIYHDGWAPCAHTPEEKITCQQFLLEQEAAVSVAFGGLFGGEDRGGGSLEAFMWALNSMGADFSGASDQWVACICEGKLTKRQRERDHAIDAVPMDDLDALLDTLGEGEEVSLFCYIQGDTFLVAFAEAFRWWKEQWEAITGYRFDKDA